MTEMKLRAHVEPIIKFLQWSQSRGVVLATWDGDGQMSDVGQIELVQRYAIEQFGTPRKRSEASTGGSDQCTDCGTELAAGEGGHGADGDLDVCDVCTQTRHALDAASQRSEAGQ